MTRSITIHPASLALGLLLASVCALGMSQSTVQTPLRVEYTPHPRDMVQIHEGTPYVVPAGKILVVTAVGSTSNTLAGFYVTVNVNGQQEMQA